MSKYGCTSENSLPSVCNAACFPSSPLWVSPILKVKRIQLANKVLGRRYFRFFRFLDCFAKSLASFHENEGLDVLLGTGKWSCMGIYLGLESITIVSYSF